MDLKNTVINTILLTLGGFCLTATLLPIVRANAWWIRVFDFPRVQIAVIALLVLLASWRWLAWSAPIKTVWLLSLAAALSEERDALEDIYEPFLIQLGFLDRTPRGRVATAKAYEYFGLTAPGKDRLW